MDSSNYHVPPGEGGASATRLALSVDPEAIGLMKHASEIGHLIDSWLQNPAQAIAPMAAYRLGRKLERFRLAARLSEGRASKRRCWRPSPAPTMRPSGSKPPTHRPRPSSARPSR